VNNFGFNEREKKNIQGWLRTHNL